MLLLSLCWLRKGGLRESGGIVVETIPQIPIQYGSVEQQNMCNDEQHQQ